MQVISQFGVVEQEPEENSEGYKMQKKSNKSKSTRGSKGASHTVSSTARHLVNLLDCGHLAQQESAAVASSSGKRKCK
jgi:hypothetical protein